MLYAERAGLDVSQVINLIGKGAAGCWSINQLGPRILKEIGNPAFTSNILSRIWDCTR